MLDYIPEAFRPKYEQHTDFSNVYRLVINIDNLTHEDFVPSFLEDGFIPKNESSDYSVSLWTKLEVLNKLRKKFEGLKKYNAIAVVDTSISRGISIKPGKHVNYYLFYTADDDVSKSLHILIFNPLSKRFRIYSLPAL